MKLGVGLSYWGAATDGDNLALAQEADRLGYAVCWAAEAYGQDAATVLAWLAGQTERIGIGSAVFQIPGRTPALTAMTAATLDSLSGGRFRLGLGISGPQVSEGWHGVRFDRPLARTREYVEVVRLALSRRRLAYEGEHFRLPLPDGPGKRLQLTVHPVRPEIPVYLAASGPRNLRLAGRIADGWLPAFFSPRYAAEQLALIGEGRAEAGRSLDGFDVVATVPLAVHDDVRQAAELVSWYTAFYIGGMGSREENFYNRQAGRLGFAEEAARIQELYLAKDYQAAARAVPFELIDATSLLGPVGRIAMRMKAFADAGVTTLTVSPFGPTLGARLASLGTALDAQRAAGLDRD